MRKLGIVAVLMLFAASAFAQGEKLLDYTDQIEGGYDFLLYVPESYYQTDASLPVVIYLHGKSCTGTDINMVTKYGTITALRRGVDIPALVIAPQVEIYKNGWEPKKVMEVLDYVIKRYRVDKNRVYVFGMSMGGSGTYKVVAAYPDRIAAAITMCGTCWVDVKPISKVPLWVIHGVDDTATPVSRSYDFVKKMQDGNMTSRLRYSYLEGCGHSILARVYMLKKAYKWLMNHSLSDEGRPISMEYDITSDDLQNLYKNLKTKPRTIPIVPVDPKKKPESTAAPASAPAKAKTPQKQQTSAKKYHVIESGDTLYKLAGKYDTKVSELCRLNGIQETDILQIGVKLRVK